MVNNNIGSSIRHFRKKRGIRQSDLAASVGISNGMLSRVENGKSSVGFDSLLLIWNKLNVSIYFVDNQDIKERIIYGSEV